MPWKWCGCCKPEREDVRELDYQHLGLKEVPVNVFVHERTLEELNLEANRVTELPRALFHCHGLRIVNLSDNDISVVPPAIASLINLQHLNLSKNSLNEIPDNIKCCKQLVYINLSVNPLEKLPDGFTQLIALEEVYLNDTFLEFLPANFGRLSKLRVLDVRENNLITLPKSIARLCNLQVLDIGKNEFSDLPEVIGNLPVLTELWADYNRIRCIPQFVGNLTKLTHLDLSNNNVNWIAGNIEKCTNLYFLALTGNELQNIPDEIGNLKNLNLLKVDDNDISFLPSTLGKLSSLNELVASQNVLEALPSTIGFLRKLEVLNVDDNRLSVLPPELGSCSSLRILSVRNNCLKSFPAELGHLASIHVINVADNFLVNLPVSILKLNQLTALWLSTNQTTPLTTLQQEIDPVTGQMMCVNFMFPQVEQERNLDEITGGREPNVERPAGPRIRFADNTELLHPSRLTRAPTPYPKELRTMAKHARILATQPRSPSVTDEHMPLLDELHVGTKSPVKIKVATVTKPSTTNLVDSSPKAYTYIKTQQGGAGDLWSRDQDSSNVGKALNLPDVLDMNGRGSTSEGTVEECVPLTADFCNNNDFDGLQVPVSGNHVVNGLFVQSRDSLSYRNENYGESEEHFCNTVDLHEDESNTKDYQVKENGKWIEKVSLVVFESEGKDKEVKYPDSENIQEANTSSNLVTHSVGEIPSQLMHTEDYKPKDLSAAKQPPPYHIAAAYSKQAAYFNNPSAYTPDLNMSYSRLSDEQQDSGNPCSGDDKFENMKSSDSVSPSVRKNQVEDTKQAHMYSSSDISPKSYVFSKTVQNIQATFNASTPEVLLSKPNDQNNDGGIFHDTAVDAFPIPLIEDMTSEHTSLTSNEEAAIEEMSNNSIEQVAADTNSLSLSFQKTSITDSSITSCSEENRSFSPQSSIPQKPLSKIPSLKSKLPQTANKPLPVTVQQSRMLQPGFYVAKQRPTSTEHAVVDNKTEASLDNNLNVSSTQNVSEMFAEPQTPVFVSKIPTVKTSPVRPGSLSSPESPTSPRAWMFGQHKNPTVFPVMIKKNPGLGFTISGGAAISGLPEKQPNGIFITKVNPNGAAATSLMPGDKILEVDGIDFSKLGHDQAVSILKQTKQVVNMMVSRQK